MGWGVVVCGFIGISLGLIPLASSYSIGVLTPSLEKEFGWSRGEIMLVPAMIYLGLSPSALVIGNLIDRAGVRSIIMFSQVALALGFLVLALTTHGNIIIFLLTYLVIGLLAEGAGPITYFRSVVGWFERYRGLALALSQSGSGLAGLFVPIYLSFIITNFGWRSAYFGLAALPVLIALPAIYFLMKELPAVIERKRESGEATPSMISEFRRSLSREGQGSDREGERRIYRSILRDYRFWVMTLVFAFTGGFLVATVVNLVPMLVDKGHSLAVAGGMASILGLFVIVGRVSLGFFLDRIYAPLLAVAVLLPAAIAAWVLTAPELSYGTSLVMIALLGLALGAEFDIVPYLMSQCFGPELFGRSYSMAYIIMNFVMAVLPSVFGYMHDWRGDYVLALQITAVVFALLPFLLFTIGKYKMPHATAADGHHPRLGRG